MVFPSSGDLENGAHNTNEENYLHTKFSLKHTRIETLLLLSNRELTQDAVRL